MKKLKNCPFCDSDNVYLDSYDPFDGYHRDFSRYRIRCLHCDAEIEKIHYDEVIEAWNRRANENDE